MIVLSALLKKLRTHWAFFRAPSDVRRLVRGVAEAVENGRERDFLLSHPYHTAARLCCVAADIGRPVELVLQDIRGAKTSFGVILAYTSNGIGLLPVLKPGGNAGFRFSARPDA